MLTAGNIDNGSARIRAIAYIPFFEKANFKVEFIPRVPQRPSNLFERFGIFPVIKRWYNLKMALFILLKHWDVVYIQRRFVWPALLKYLNVRNIPFVFDFDDAIYINPRKPNDQKRTIAMVIYADCVIVSTDYLVGFCRSCGKDPVVIPSPVETDRLYPLPKLDTGILTIGWMGSPWTSVFLKVVEKPLQQLAELYQFNFLTIGAAPDYKIEGVNHVALPWIYSDENQELAKMDIGIMPLPDTTFTQMKGGYKLLQYFSAAIPCVASPVGINQAIIKQDINGYLASNEQEWYIYLEKLMLDNSLRAKLGLNGRKDAIDLYSREICFKKLREVLKKLSV